MKIYAGLGSGTAAQLIERAKTAESAGMDGVWAEQLNGGAPFVPLATVAGHTSRIQLGTSIALAFTRSPLETALTALDMDYISGGRFNLGLGSGVQRLVEMWHGVKNYGKAVPHLRQTVELVRMIIKDAHTGKPITYQSEYYDVKVVGWRRPIAPVRERIPIYLAGVQGGMARLAGEVAEGMLGHIIWSPYWIKEVIHPNVKIGLDRAGRKRSDIELTVPLVVIISKDRKAARHDAAREVGFFSTVRTYQPLFEAHGFGKLTTEIQQIFKTEGGHSPKIAQLVTDEMIDAFTVVGTVDEVRKKIAVFKDLVDGIMVEVPGFHMDSEKTNEYRTALFETFGR
ncbi:MAG: LLM class flavin-dependent oxidoreductase [Chloroflexi bacterium]|nr:LLM class flavin-dependent oxidoreductase [Chloroflexota bacterium]